MKPLRFPPGVSHMSLLPLGHPWVTWVSWVTILLRCFSPQVWTALLNELFVSCPSISKPLDLHYFKAIDFQFKVSPELPGAPGQHPGSPHLLNIWLVSTVLLQNELSGSLRNMGHHRLLLLLGTFTFPCPVCELLLDSLWLPACPLRTSCDAPFLLHHLHLWCPPELHSTLLSLEDLILSRVYNYCSCDSQPWTYIHLYLMPPW